MPDLATLPSDIPSELPALAPAVVVVAFPTGSTLYRVFDSETPARTYWQAVKEVGPGQRAFLFIDAELVAFAANL